MFPQLKSELRWQMGGAQGISANDIVWQQREYLFACRDYLCIKGNRREWWTFEPVIPDASNGEVVFSNAHSGDAAFWPWREAVWFADLADLEVPDDQ